MTRAKREKMASGVAALLQPPSPEEIARRKAVGARIAALREQMPTIAPLTTADLVHMSRDDAFWYGEGAPGTNDTGA